MIEVREKLARRAAAGDLASAMRLVTLLQDEGAPLVTTPGMAEERIRSALVEKIEEAIRNATSPRGFAIDLFAEERYVREVVAKYERVGWTVVVVQEAPATCVKWHLIFSGFRVDERLP